MQCLVVGGTGFLGGAIVDRLAMAGHFVDVLSRGNTQRTCPDNVRFVQADRHSDLSEIKSKQYDWVFDTCAFSPDAVDRLLDAVGEDIKRYIFISSLSVYANYETQGLTEEHPCPTATDQELAAIQDIPADKKGSAPAYGSAYGPLKRSCEIAAEKRLADRSTNLRVGLLVGAGDYTDRLGYWVRRIDEAHGNRKRMIAPAPKNRLVQMIDVHDIADFALLCAANGFGGNFNITSSPMRFADLLQVIATKTGSQPEINWVTNSEIVAANISPWTNVPMMPPDSPQFKHFFEVDTSKAIKAGLRCRPLPETLLPLINWDRTRREINLKCGLTQAMEDKLLPT
ncbi:NAD-dependent epimerase/dehydratase family protein [Maritalea porphyrae]|uniref:NAD-dependent epimerase/dehydratase family protein n=1 Tax=Maritalea porphyrae TaxID=880732 RepID=UPI0022B06982|nr:NAD-dependent epimerase/dehydratase family protein [Maritalea porphyrae]MCZ4272422.1 NAD-dependent epimerase/dehydratase family protein [Maritalea porphyrae]